MTQLYWALAQHDMDSVIEASNEEAGTAYALAIGAAGNIRTRSLRALGKDEMDSFEVSADTLLSESFL